MANEISISTAISGQKNGVTVSGSKSYTQTIQTTLGIVYHTEQVVGTNKESLVTGDVSLSDESILWLRNLDSTHIVSAWCVSQQPPNFYIRPGETLGPIRVYGGQLASWSLQSATAASNVEVIIIEAGDPAS